MTNIKQATKIDQDKKLDKELKDTFPASDPPSGNNFTGAPKERQSDEGPKSDTDEKKKARK